MKKNKILLTIIICMLFMITGCGVTKESREGILKALQKEKIVDKDLKLVDTVTDVNAGLFISKTTYYIYENEDNELTAIQYSSSKSSKDDFSVTIYYNVSINEDIKYISSTPENYFIYENGKKSVDNKYNLKNGKHYTVYKAKFLFFEMGYKVR